MTAHVQAGSVIQTDDGPKKVRKPYTITKSRESWTEAEHLKFLEALQLYDRDWKKIEAFVGTKTVIQIRSHAQKYILKVQKNGTGEHVPPPRPKRKSALPYPHKAPKPVTSASASLPVPLTPPSPSSLSTPAAVVTGTPVTSAPSLAPETLPAASLPTGPPPPPLLASSSTPGSLLPHSGGVVGSAPAQPLRPPPPPAARTWLHHGAPPPGGLAYGVQGSGAQGNAKSSNAVQAAGKGGKSKSSSGSSTLPSWQGSAPTEGSRPDGQKRGAPDFAEVYKFIGSVFDPGSCNHIHRLKDMAPIDRETVVLLMRNLALNISSPEFSEEKLFMPTTTMPAVEAPSPVGSELGLPCSSSPSHMRGVRPPLTPCPRSLLPRGESWWWLAAKDGDEEGPYVGMSGPPGWVPQGGAMGPDGGHMHMHRNGSMMNGMGGNGWQPVPGPMAMHWWNGGMGMGGGPVEVEHTQYSGGEEGQTFSDAGPT